MRLKFNVPAEFLAELSARGPNVEPRVRLTTSYRSTMQGIIQQLSVCASYLRHEGEVAYTVHLAHYIGDVWPGMGPERESNQKVEARRDAVYAEIEAVCQANAWETAAGQWEEAKP